MTDPTEPNRADRLSELAWAKQAFDFRAAAELAEEARRVAEALPADDPGRARSLARASLLCASTHSHLAEVDHAADRLEETFHLLDEDDDPALRVWALALQASLRMYSGHDREAVGILDRAADLDRLRGFRDRSTFVRLQQQAAVYLSMGRQDEALGVQKDALEIARELGEHHRAAKLGLLSAEILIDRGEVAPATRRIAEVLEAAGEFGDQGLEARAHGAHARLQTHIGDYAAAIEGYRAAAELQRQTGRVRDLAVTLSNLAGSLLSIQAPDEALRSGREAIGMWREFGARAEESTTLLILSKAHEQLGEREKAMDSSRRALAIAEDVGRAAGVAGCLVRVGELSRGAGETAAAREAYGRALEISREAGDSAGELIALLGLIDTELVRGEHEAGSERLAEAIERAERWGDPELLSDTHELASRIFEALGDAERALVHHRIYHETMWSTYRRESDARLEKLRVLHQVEAARHRAEVADRRADRRNAARLQAIVNNTPNVAIHALDREGRVRLWNRAAETVFGWSKREAEGRTAAELVLPESAREEFAALLREVEVTGRPVGPKEWEFRRKDGRTGLAESTVFSVTGDRGERLFVRVDVDRTDRRRVEEELRRALADLERMRDRLQAENVYLQEEIRESFGLPDEIVGDSEALRGVLHQVDQVASTNLTVLVLGETGTGKELVARAIHARSPRADRPLVKVNCAALPASLIESELFGHEKGAFTGALAKKTGRFELADGGTIFLDEIGDLPVELQAKLLRVLQEGELERLGGTETLKVDVRVIAATNRDLQRSVDEGSFRPDLYYRLRVFPIEIPPLRARPEDIPLLVWHVIRQNEKPLGKRIGEIPAGVMRLVCEYDWPGNVRELENIVQRAMLLSPGETLRVDHAFPAPERDEPPDRRAVSLKEAERAHILRVLDDCGWKIKGRGNAAERLGLPPSTLRLRMKRLGIRRP